MATTKVREPAKLHESHSRSLKTKHAKSGKKVSLKRFVASLSDDESKIQRDDWLHNKRANTAKPLHGIGRTRTRVKKGGGNKGAPEKNLSGK